MPKPRPRTVALLAAVATYLFWFEYLPPFKRVHLWSDIEGFHWPLMVAAFEALRHGRIPLWDPSIYCGIPFAGNIQSALFYPPSWLLFAANVCSKHVLFKTVEAWVFLHAWVAFFLCYLWLRGRRSSLAASLMGAAVFAFGGYMVSQNNHVGVVTGYAWTPLAWLGIDEALERRSWRPMWKLIAASALCFLAGYPASFAAFAIGTVVYAAARSWRSGVAAVAGIGASLAVAAVAALPAMEASRLKTFDPKYGPGLWDPQFYLQMAIPDWVGFRAGDPAQYLYLGVPVLFGILWFWKRPDRAALAVLGVCALLVFNPYEVVSKLVAKSAFLVQVFPKLNMIEPATLAFALVAASGIDAFLAGKRPRAAWAASRPFAWTAAVLLAAWSAYRLWIWPGTLAGWRSVAATAVMLALFAAGLLALRAGKAWVAILLCAAVFVDYKVSGTSRPFSAVEGDLEPFYPRNMFPGVDPAAYDAIKAHREYRLAVDWLHPTDLRRYGLTTPQGFDPLVPQRYKAWIERSRTFRTNRLFDLRPSDEKLLGLLGVRYFITRQGAPYEPEARAHPDFRLVGPKDSFFQVYEYLKASPPWRWEGAGAARAARWEPELREFRVDAQSAGRFALVEEFYPGWRATVDGRAVPIEPWNDAFQAVAVPPGAHTVRFEYRPASVRAGALISVLSLLAMGFWLWKTRTPRLLNKDADGV